MRSGWFWPTLCMATVPINYYFMREADKMRDRAMEIYNQIDRLRDDTCHGFSSDNSEESDQDLVHI